MKPEDVFALKGVSDPRLSPDGTTVAYVPWSIDGEANEYRGNIWLAAVDGSEPPRRFTTGERRDGEPRWSPDGSRLAFVSSRAEKEPGQLYVISLRGGEAQKLTKLKEDVRGVAWSPDGKTIAFTSRVRDEASRGGGRAPEAAETHHAPALQARQRGLDRRPALADLRRPRGRKRGAATAHRRRAGSRRAGVVAGRQAARLFARHAATTGTRSSSPTSTSCRPRAESRSS